eukprot:8885349-Ditylum_brightwellii.AAC.1
MEWWWVAANSSLVMASRMGGVMRGEWKSWALSPSVQAILSAAAWMKVSAESLGSAARLCPNCGRAATVLAWQRQRMR